MNKIPQVAVLSGFGINCELETMAVFELAGAKATRIHANRLVNGEYNLDDFHILAVPGGFSFGDHLGSGRLMGNRLRFGLREQIQKLTTKDSSGSDVAVVFETVLTITKHKVSAQLYVMFNKDAAGIVKEE